MRNLYCSQWMFLFVINFAHKPWSLLQSIVALPSYILHLTSRQYQLEGNFYSHLTVRTRRRPNAYWPASCSFTFFLHALNAGPIQNYSILRLASRRSQVHRTPLYAWAAPPGGSVRGTTYPPLLEPAGYKGAQWQALSLSTWMEFQ